MQRLNNRTFDEYVCVFHWNRPGTVTVCQVLYLTQNFGTQPTPACVCVWACMFCVWMYMYVCVCACVYAHPYVCACVCTRVCEHACMTCVCVCGVCVCVRVYAHCVCVVWQILVYVAAAKLVNDEDWETEEGMHSLDIWTAGFISTVKIDGLKCVWIHISLVLAGLGAGRDGDTVCKSVCKWYISVTVRQRAQRLRIRPHARTPAPAPPGLRDRQASR